LKIRVRGTQERINPVSIILKGKNCLGTRTIWNSNGVLEQIKFGFRGITVPIILSCLTFLYYSSVYYSIYVNIFLCSACKIIVPSQNYWKIIFLYWKILSL